MIFQLKNKSLHSINYNLQLKAALKDLPLVSPKTQIVAANTLPDHNTMKDIGNLCILNCSVCRKVFTSFKCLVNHHKQDHNGKSGPYKTEQVAEARYHKGHICAKSVLCDNAVIVKHLTRHKLNVSQYKERFVLKNGGRVFPTFLDYCHNNNKFEILTMTKGK